MKLKCKLKSSFLEALLIIAAFQFLTIMIQEVKAPATPFQLVKNPTLNDPAYWSNETFGYPISAYSNITSNGWEGYVKMGRTDYSTLPFYDIRYMKPWGCAHAIQGLLFQAGLTGKEASPTNEFTASKRNINSQYFSELGFSLPVLGQGLNYYVYIPANISDGQIIINVTVTRLSGPSLVGTGTPMVDFYMVNTRLFAEIACGVGLWFAPKVQFWDTPDVPPRLRGKTAYLGWMSPNMFGEPNMFVGEAWCDFNIYDTDIKEYISVSREIGNSGQYPTVDLNGMLGSMWDWDWHSSPTLNTTTGTETITIDLGKWIRGFVDWSNNPVLRNDLFIGRLNQGGGRRQSYSFVGFTFIAVGPTMEAVSSEGKYRVSWLQVYDYRSSNGEPIVDPDFWKFIKVWKFKVEHGLPDPYCESWANTVLPREIQNIILTHSYIMTPESSNPVIDGYFGYAEAQYQYGTWSSYHFYTDGIWAKAGVNYTYTIFPVGIDCKWAKTFKGQLFNDLACKYFSIGSEWKNDYVVIYIYNRLKYQNYNSKEYALVRIQESDNLWIELAFLGNGKIDFWINSPSTGKVLIGSGQWSPDVPTVFFTSLGYTYFGIPADVSRDFARKHAIPSMTFKTVAVHGSGSFDGTLTVAIGNPVHPTVNSFTAATIWTYRYGGGKYPQNCQYGLEYKDSTGEGEIIFADYLTLIAGWSEPKFNVVTVRKNIPFTAQHPMETIQVLPHIECWNGKFELQGSIYISFEFEASGTYPVAVNVSATQGGQVSPSGLKIIQAEQNFTLTATPDPNKCFLYWTVENSLFGVRYYTSQNPHTLLNVKIDYNVTAVFGTPPPVDFFSINVAYKNVFSYELEEALYGYHVDRVKGYTDPPFGIYNFTYRTAWTLKAYPYAGYLFVCWIGVKQNGQWIQFPTGQSQITVEANSTWKTFLAYFSSCLVAFKVVDSLTGAKISNVTVQLNQDGYYVNLNYSKEYWYVGSEKWNCFWIQTGSYQLVFSKSGYYRKIVNVNVYSREVDLTVYLDPIVGSPLQPMSKHYQYDLEVINASSSSYSLWNKLITVYPVTGRHVTLTLKIHYYTDTPILEIYASNISAICLNIKGIYDYLKCPFYKKASKAIFIVYIDTPVMISVENMSFKPVEIWKHKPGDAKPVKISNWSFAGNILTFAVSAEDPAFSILSNPLQESIDLAHQMAAILIVLVMLAVALGFVKRWVSNVV